MNLNDLPDEMLCTIFDHLDVYELKLASIVCRRWSELTFSGRRMNHVLLMLPDPKHWNKYLINSKRCYRNVRLTNNLSSDNHLKSFVRLLRIKPHVRMLETQTSISCQRLSSVLLEASELQQLSIIGPTDLDQIYCNNNASLQALTELKRPNRRQLFSFFRTNIPKLQCLEMGCNTDIELDAWKVLSGQLKLGHVNNFLTRYLQPFLELTFPSLEDLAINRPQIYIFEEMPLEGSDVFFRRHPFLRRLSLCYIFPEKVIQNISHHCPELTHLSFVLEDSEDGILESLVRLNKLKHLSLEGGGNVHRKIPRGAFKSLESVELHPYRVLFENLFEVVPRLSCLKITEYISCDVLEFICEKFSCLRRLELVFGYWFSRVADDSVRFDRLMHLQELKISDNIKIRSIHRNNVRCLTITSCSKKWYLMHDKEEAELYQIPEKFPLLKTLNFECLRIWWGEIGSLSVTAVERLQKLIPSCRIDRYGQRFYPIADVTAE